MATKIDRLLKLVKNCRFIQNQIQTHQKLYFIGKFYYVKMNIKCMKLFNNIIPKNASDYLIKNAALNNLENSNEIGFAKASKSMHLIQFGCDEFLCQLQNFINFIVVWTGCLCRFRFATSFSAHNCCNVLHPFVCFQSLLNTRL